jgi:predicted PurR-regulated permease PerM
MAAAASSAAPGDSSRRRIEISISIQTILLIAAAVALAWAVVKVANILLVIFVAAFGVAVLTPVVDAVERRLHWRRGLAATAVVVGVLVALGAVALVVVDAMSSAVRDFSDALPGIVDKARHSDLGDFLNGGSSALDTLRDHASDITKGVGHVSGGVAHIGASAFGAVAGFFSVLFLTIFGLADAPRLRDWIVGLMYPDTRERFVRVSGQIVHTTSRYMIGNVAISVICGTVYGVTAVILDVPFPLALALIAAVLDLIPTLGATIAGVIIALVSLSVSVDTMLAFVAVIVVYQQVENYLLQPTIIGKVTKISGFTVLASVLVFGAVFGLAGAILAVPIASGIQIVVQELTAGRRARIAAAGRR